MPLAAWLSVFNNDIGVIELRKVRIEIENCLNLSNNIMRMFRWMQVCLKISLGLLNGSYENSLEEHIGYY